MDIVNKYHLLTNHGHGDVVLEDLKRLYITATFGTLIKELIKSCAICVSTTKIDQPTLIYPVRSFRPNERWTVDYTQLEENIWLLFIIDNFDKIVWGQVFPTKEEQNVIDLFLWIVNNCCCKPQILQSDNGGEFTGHSLQQVLAAMLVILIHGVMDEATTQNLRRQSRGLTEHSNSY